MTKGKALSIAQERLWVLERLHPDNPANNISYGLRLTGPLDVDKLKHAWSEVVQQHEILRTGFEVTDGIPQAISLASCSAQFTARDLESVSPQEREQTLMRVGAR